jgi:hypothetical protein
MTNKTYPMHSNINEALAAAVKDAEEAEAYVEVLEASLNKAVEALTKITDGIYGDAYFIAHNALIEIGEIK